MRTKCDFLLFLEKNESLLGSSEDKEMTEQDNKKASEQEVSLYL